MATPIVLYGYRITIPVIDSYDFIRDMYSMNDILEEPMKVHGIVPHHDMINDRAVQLILGFVPDSNLTTTLTNYEILKDFITDNPMFNGIELASTPLFHTGFEWNYDVVMDNESEESEESEENEDSEESDVSDDYSSEHSSYCAESDDSIQDETNDKSLSDYISKYYI